jgi:aerobic carbon-monoxide dehydrogenase small subunit
VTAFLRDNPEPSDEEIRHALSGNLCRCTGYQGILKAVRQAAEAGVDSDRFLRGSARSGAQNREENQ